MLDDQGGMVQSGTHRVGHEEDRKKGRAAPETDSKELPSQRARRLTLRPIAMSNMPMRPATIGANGGLPVCASRAVVVAAGGRAGGVGVAVTAAIGQAVGRVPVTGLTGRKVDANPTSGWVVDKGSGAAVALEPGRE